MGERSGYPDIKIGPQTELITLRTYIEVYMDFIKDFESRLKKNKKRYQRRMVYPFMNYDFWKYS